MKARLNILGRKHEIVSVGIVNYVTGEKEEIYDSEYYSAMPEEEKVDLATCIESPNIKVKIVEDINQLLEDSKQHLTVLEKQMVQELLNHNGLPFGDSTLPNLVKEYKEHKDYIDGVASALEVVQANDNDA